MTRPGGGAEAARNLCALLLAGFWLFLPVPSCAADAHPCAEGVELRFSSGEPRQGSLLLLEVRATHPLVEPKAAWGSQLLRFWRENPSENIHRALVGVDLGREPGVSPFTFAAQLSNGHRLACSALLSVQESEFIVERLRVPRRFVEVSPKNRERARREGQILREVWGAVTPERFWEGKFLPPVEEVEAAGNFGRRRFLNGQPRSPHSGEDFPAPRGTPVRAAQRGRVALARNFFFSGNTVVLDHGLGLYTFYGHLESLAVKEGDVVEAGALVGRVGATGRVTGTHLHWAVRVNNTRVNPLDLLALFSP